MSKSKKTIKVVDIVADDAVIEADEPIVEILDIEPIENAVLDIEKETEIVKVIPPAPIKNELKTAVKTSDLTECEKCHKMVMNKTLKYSHFKTCGVVKTKTPITPITPITPMTPIEIPITPIKQIETPIETPVIKKTIKSVSAIRQVKKPVIIKQPIPVQEQPPIITLDQIRTEYFNNVKQQRTIMMQKLFSNAI